MAKKRGGMVGCPRIEPKCTKVAGGHPDWKACRHFPQVLVQIPATELKDLVAGEAIRCKLYCIGRPKGKSRFRFNDS